MYLPVPFKKRLSSVLKTDWLFPNFSIVASHPSLTTYNCVTKFNENKVNRPNLKINPQPSLYLSIAIFYKLDIALTTLGSEMYNHEQTQKAVHKNIWMPNECL